MHSVTLLLFIPASSVLESIEALSGLSSEIRIEKCRTLVAGYLWEIYTVTTDIKTNYDIGSRRPVLFDVSYMIDSVPIM